MNQNKHNNLICCFQLQLNICDCDNLSNLFGKLKKKKKRKLNGGEEKMKKEKTEEKHENLGFEKMSCALVVIQDQKCLSHTFFHLIHHYIF